MQNPPGEPRTSQPACLKAQRRISPLYGFSPLPRAHHGLAFSSVQSSPNSSLPAFQLTSAWKLSFNFKPNKHDCIYFPEDDKAHRRLDLQSYYSIYLGLLGKQISSHIQRQRARQHFITMMPLSFHEELEMLKLLTIKAEHFRNDRMPQKL